MHINPINFISIFHLLQSRRTSERFVKPAIPTTSLGLNTSAPNIMSHHGSILGALGGCGSNNSVGNLSGTQQGIGGNNALNLTMPTLGSNSNSLNSSLSSSSNSTLPTNSSISFAGHSAFTQPASPMDTSVYKD